jgi:hypothetical protein
VRYVDRARAWLAEADPSPDHARTWWEASDTALIPVGKKWDAVKVEVAWAQAALARPGINGPVISDGRRTTGYAYFLVPPGTAPGWKLGETESLGDTCWLGIPAPERTIGPQPHWVRPPDGYGRLTHPLRLRAALEAVR